jgi:thymidine phosphorylase
MLVETSRALGTAASALITDMSQPLGCWVGHTAEVMESLACLEGDGPADLMEVTLALAEEVSQLVGRPLSRGELEAALVDGRARRRFDEWAVLQGADPAWLAEPSFPLAPAEHPLRAGRAGRLEAVDNRQVGLLMVEAGGGRRSPGAAIDFGVSLRVDARVGQEVREGDELARLYLRTPNEHLAARFADCFTVGAGPVPPPPLIAGRVG